MEEIVAAGPLLLGGFGVTVALAALSLALATALGALGAAAKLGGGRALRVGAEVYTTVFRGVPELVTVLIVYFAGQRAANAAAGAVGLEGIEISTFLAGVLSLGLTYGAYLTETFRGAYRAIPEGQVDAARAFGLSRGRTLARIVAPQLMRFALPGFTNIWQVLAKATAVVSVIGLNDLVGLAVKIGRRERDPFTFLLVVLVAYLLLTSISGWLLGRAEKRLARGF
jgi:His/Glu/Gln/Arg/opine family amino acid ABC transporter permease subunit